MKTLPASSVAAVVCDPPYSSGSGALSKNTRPDGEWFSSDCMSVDAYGWWMRGVALEAFRLVATGGQAHMFTDWRQYPTLRRAWESAGWTTKTVVVWDKAKAGALGTFWRNNHEWAVVFGKGGVNWPKGCGQFNTHCESKPRGSLHPTQKPDGLMRHLLRGVMPRGGLIVDPFAGSGSTGVAAIAEGFRFLGIECDERYLDLARQRLAEAAQLFSVASSVASSAGSSTP